MSPKTAGPPKKEMEAPPPPPPKKKVRSVTDRANLIGAGHIEITKQKVDQNYVT